MDARHFTAVALLGATLSLTAGADDFVQIDEIVSSPGVPLSDPEFDEVDKRVAWQLGPNAQIDGTLLVADVDPDTGDILDPQTGVPLRDGGRGLVLDTQLVERTVTGNGPEWALGADGGQIVYTRLNEAGEASLGIATFDGQSWQAGLLPFGSNRFTPKGSRLPGDPTPRVGYYGFVNGPAGAEVRLGARVIDQPRTEVTTPVRTGGGNFIPGEAVFVTTATSPAGYPQVYVFDTDTGAFDQVTFDAGAKLQSPELWTAPDFGDRMLFTVNTRLGASGEARVYSRPDAADSLTWTLEAVIASPVPGKPFVKSPRPFVFEGKSYITFIVQPGPGRSTAGEIWISDLEPDPGLRFMRKVSEGAPNDTDVRFDPETFLTTNGPIIYYTHVIGGVPVLRRAQTGLVPAPGGAPTASFTAVPNPVAIGDSVTLDGSASSDDDGVVVAWDWDFEDDGVFDASGPQVMTSYAAPGNNVVRLRVTDDTALTDETTLTIEVVEAP